MKAPEFDYARPESLEEVFDLLDDKSRDTRLLAGGQSLIAALNFRLDAPELLIDINQIDDISGISEDGNTIRIGALTRHVEVENSQTVAQHLPLLSKAIGNVAHAAIRNRGTFGGSLALADPAAEIPACCLAYDAMITVNSSGGSRAIKAADFFHGLYETALEDHEIITAIEFAKRTPDDLFAFDEITRRHGDYAMAGLAFSATLNEAIEAPKIVFFGISDRPVRSFEAEAILSGARLDQPAIAAATSKATDGIELSSDTSASEAMKAHLAGTLLNRALTGILEGRP